MGGSDIGIESIEKDFLKNIKKNRNPYKLIEDSIANGEIKIGKTTYVDSLTTEQLAILNILESQFEKLITGKPSQLKEFIDQIDYNEIREQGRNGEVLTKFGNGIFNIFSYDSNFRGVKRKGLWLAEKLNIKACPYCNSQYTLVVKNSNDKLKAKFQFDHFFSKKRYPYLSLSLYNLIPSCASCNLSKGDEKTDLYNYFNPYRMNLANRTHFQLEFKPDLKNLTIGKIEKLDLKILWKAHYKNHTKLVENHNEMFDIEAVYERHHDIVEELLFKSLVNNSDFKQSAMQLKGVFNNDESIYNRYTLGTYGLEEEINERPLTKLTQDIAKQLDLI